MIIRCSVLSATLSRYCAQNRFATLFMAVLIAMVPALAVVTKPGITTGVVLLGVIAIFALLGRGEFRIGSRLAAGAILITFCLLLISCFYGVGTHEARDHITRWVMLLPLGLAIITYARNQQDIPARSWFLLLAGYVLAILYAVFSGLTNYKWQFRLYGGEHFSPTDFNKTLVALVMMGPAILYPFWAQGGRMRYLSIAVAILLAYAAISSYAQSAALGVLVVALGTVMPVQSRTFWRLVRVVTVAGTLAMPFVMPYAFEHYAAPLKQFRITAEASAPERLEVWSAVSQEIQKKPIFGHGYSAGRVMDFTEIKKIYYWNEDIVHTHNFVLQAWLEYGVVGALMLAVLIVLLWRRIQSVEDRRIRRLYFMSASSAIAIALVGWSIWQTWWMLLMFLVPTINLLAASQIARVPAVKKITNT